MWIMTSYGVLMPAHLPQEFRPLKHPEWDLQVRARDRDALIKLRTKMLEFGANVGRIRDTRTFDYEWRMYCDKASFANVMALEIMAIDYRKFKPTTERPGMGGDDLHNLYDHIWYVMAQHYESPILIRTLTKKTTDRG